MVVVVVDTGPVICTRSEGRGASQAACGAGRLMQTIRYVTSTADDDGVEEEEGGGGPDGAGVGLGDGV